MSKTEMLKLIALAADHLRGHGLPPQSGDAMAEFWRIVAKAEFLTRKMPDDEPATPPETG